ncbi:hypothetical protein [Kribbella deserti]|uniref:Cupin n=1 Tax=Kribbella deserti TaxID=1926257 RepID=A0ABV6QRI9_9ACTN
MTAGTTVEAPDGTKVVLGEIGTRVVFENTRVRVWEVALDPGEAQGWHLHHNPYVVLCLSTSPCHMDWLDGSPARQLSETVGGSVYRPVSPVHMLTNDGDAPYRNRLIEVLDLGEEASGEPQVRDGDAAGALTASSGSGVPVRVVLEEDDVRVRHVIPEPDASYTWVTGATPSLVVDLDLETEATAGVRYLEAGETYELPAKSTRTSGYNIVELLYYGRA